MINLDSEIKETYDILILPFVINKKVIRNGIESYAKVDNISSEESKRMSCEPKFLVRENDELYLTDLPLFYSGTGIRWQLCYVYDDLTEEERVRFADRFEIIKATRPYTPGINIYKKEEKIKKVPRRVKKKNSSSVNKNN